MTDNMKDIIQQLRHGERVTFYDRYDKMFVTYQLNRYEKRIYWERWVSKDRRNWLNWDKYLSLKDVLSCIEYHKTPHGQPTIVII